MNNVTQSTLRATSFFLCGAIALYGLQAAAGAPASNLPQQRVGFADLDISTAAGAKVLYSRIAVAARQVCADYGLKDLATMARVNECVDLAIDNAVKKVNAPALSALRPRSAIHLAKQ
jgi:UrcA family protein